MRCCCGSDFLPGDLVDPAASDGAMLDLNVYVTDTGSSVSARSIIRHHRRQSGDHRAPSTTILSSHSCPLA